jgi:hypothetical protein
MNPRCLPSTRRDDEATILGWSNTADGFAGDAEGRFFSEL